VPGVVDDALYVDEVAAAVVPVVGGLFAPRLWNTNRRRVYASDRAWPIQPLVCEHRALGCAGPGELIAHALRAARQSAVRRIHKWRSDIPCRLQWQCAARQIERCSYSSRSEAQAVGSCPSHCVVRVRAGPTTQRTARQRSSRGHARRREVCKVADAALHFRPPCSATEGCAAVRCATSSHGAGREMLACATYCSMSWTMLRNSAGVNPMSTSSICGLLASRSW